MIYSELPRAVEYSGEFPTGGLYLLLIFSHPVYPHLALLNHRTYWSVGLNKKSCGVDAEPKWNSLRRKNIPVLLFKITSSAKDEDLLNKVFASAPDLTLEGQTCLSAIVDFFKKQTGLPLEAEVVSDLLIDLARANRIEYQVYMDFKKDNLPLLKYTRDEVLEHIRLSYSSKK
jgi:hypothetical protein